jgi:hypothetical protein
MGYFSPIVNLVTLVADNFTFASSLSQLSTSDEILTCCRSATTSPSIEFIVTMYWNEREQKFFLRFVNSGHAVLPPDLSQG